MPQIWSSWCFWSEQYSSSLYFGNLNSTVLKNIQNNDIVMKWKQILADLIWHSERTKLIVWSLLREVDEDIRKSEKDWKYWFDW